MVPMLACLTEYLYKILCFYHKVNNPINFQTLTAVLKEVRADFIYTCTHFICMHTLSLFI